MTLDYVSRLIIEKLYLTQFAVTLSSLQPHLLYIVALPASSLLLF